MNIMTMKPFMFLITLLSDDLDGHEDPVCSYDRDEHNDHETFYVLDNLDYQMTWMDMMILIALMSLLILLTLIIIITCMIMMILMNIMTMTHYNHDDPDEYNDNGTNSLIESSAPILNMNY